MLLSIVLTGLAALTAASPAAQPYPTKQRSPGFRLVINITDLARDFSPSIQYTYLTTIHTGAAQNLLGIGDDSTSRIFYINGTATEFMIGQATTISDGATPPVPFGFTLHPDAEGSPMSTAHLDAGLGDKGYVLTRFPVPYVFLAPEQMAICYESVPYYKDQLLYILKQLNWSISKVLPDNCAPVRLMAECADLDKLPPNSIASHDHVYEAECYKSVKSIEWTKYAPW